MQNAEFHPFIRPPEQWRGGIRRSWPACPEGRCARDKGWASINRSILHDISCDWKNQVTRLYTTILHSHLDRPTPRVTRKTLSLSHRAKPIRVSFPGVLSRRQSIKIWRLHVHEDGAWPVPHRCAQPFASSIPLTPPLPGGRRPCGGFPPTRGGDRSRRRCRHRCGNA